METLNTSNLPYREVSNFERFLITLITMFGAFMAVLDSTIVDIIIPKIMAPLSTDLYGIQWIITAYMIASATFLLLSEWLDSKFGLKNIFLFGISLFTVSSFVCGISTSLDMMITARVFQGIGEAFIMASSQIILFSVYPKEKKGLAMGIYGLGVSFAPALGPTLGGYLTDFLNWRWVFFINVPIGLLTTLLGFIYLPKLSIAKKDTKLNFVSFVLLSIFTISTLVILSKGQQKGWFNSDLIITLTFISVLFLLFYILSELLSKKPLIDFSIFLNREYFVGISIFFLLLGFSMYQIFYLIPLYFEHLKGLSTLDTGIHILGLALFIALFSPIAGILSDKIGEKNVLYITSALYIFSSLYIMPKLDYFTPNLEAGLMLIPLGISMGMFFAPVTTLALRNLNEKASIGTGLLHYSRFIGGSFGTAIATNSLYKYSNEHFEGINNIQSVKYTEVVYNKLVNNFAFLTDLEKAKKLGYAMIYKLQSLYSLSWSFQDTFFIAGLFGIVGALPMLIFLYTDLKKLFTHLRVKKVL
ncbi:MAG: MFS transporter [Persephonella sp.]|nr:MAG: MFS transporter [Persephonella sp.]